MARAIFLSLPVHLDGHGSAPPGGVQVATAEYLAVIRAAGISLETATVDIDRSLWAGVRRRISASPYRNALDPLAALQSIQSGGQSLDYVFLNTDSLAQLVGPVRHVAHRDTRVVLLSIGPVMGDAALEYRAREFLSEWGVTTSMKNARSMGTALVDEIDIRKQLDLVVALSEQDARFEAWLGAPRVVWLPRIVSPRPLAWRGPNRVLGFVGTLEHAPNLHGLVQVLDALERGKASQGGWVVEVVGGPPGIGTKLERRYPFVRYLGRLDSAALEDAARGWGAFLHPIFDPCRGASTKLAQGMSWEIPVVTTTLGARGYRGVEGALTFAESPEEFASECLHLCDEHRALANRDGVRRAIAAGPTPSVVAEEFRRALRSLVGGLTGQEN